MTTIIIDNPQLEKKYSEYEIKMKFIEFLEKDMKENIVSLYEVTENNLSEKSQERLKNINNLNFIDY